MTPIAIFLIFLAIGLTIFLVVIVPLLIQLRHTASSIEVLAKQLDNEIPLLSKSITETSEEISSLASSLNDKMAQTDYVVEQVREVSDLVLDTSHLLHDKIAPLLINISGFNAGLQTFLHFFRK